MTTPGGFEDAAEETAEEPSGVMAEALAGVAAMLGGVATEAPPDDEAAPEEPATEVDDMAEADDAADAEAALVADESTDVVAEEEEEGATAEPAVTEGDSTATEVAEAEAAPETTAEPTAAEDAEAEGEEEEEEEEEEVLPPASPYDLPGGWYVVHSYSGYENKVKANLGTRIKSMHMEDSIFDIVIPMEDVVEIKAGRKVTVPRKQFPGYILVRMYMDDDSWGVVRNTPGVTGFVGSGTKPTPLSRREVERILGVRKDEEKKAPRFKPDWEVGETVRVIDGPFADFNGIIEDINVDQSKVRVLVDIFGRETPVELNFEQIQKF